MNLKKAIGAFTVALIAVAAALPLQAQNAPPGAPAGARPGMGPGAGQMQGGTIRGTVHDAAGAPVPAAQVSVWSAADSSLVTGAVAGADGSFRIVGVRPGRYYVRVSALGHQTATVSPVAITPQATEADVGTVRLAQGAVQLEALTVTAERSTAAFEVDRNTYRTRDLPATTGGNASDVLQNIPALEVDPDGRVSLRGSQNVAVQINGRPAPLRGDQLANFLRQLPAHMIESVEVIPNPSARYEPEGMAGIVNIVLRENADLGLSYGLVLAAGTGDRYNGSANVGWQAGPLTLFGSYGYRNDERRNTGFNYLERYTPGQTRPVSYLEQDVRGVFDMRSHLFNGSADLRVGRRDVLSSTFMVSSGSFDNSSINTYLEMGEDSVARRRYQGRNAIGIGNLTYDAGLAFKHTVVPSRHEFSAELRYNRGDNENLNQFIEESLFGVGPADPRLENTSVNALTRNLTAQADFSRPLAERTRLETGYKGTLRLIDNAIAVERFDPQSGLWVPSEARSNAFEYDERVHAGYAVLSQGVGRVDLQAGLRAERTDREFHLTTTNESFPRNYWSFFPSALVALTVDDQRQVRASYSRRIRRPDTRFLNPFPFSEDQLNRFVGNPNLDPEYTNAFEVAFQQALPRGSIQATPYFRRTEGAVRRLREIRGDTSIVSFQNLATSDSYGMDLNGSLRLSRVSGFASVSAFRVVTDGTNVSDQLANDAFGWSARLNGTFQITPRLDLQGFLMYRAAMETEQGRMGSMTMSNIGVRQKLLGDRATLGLRVQDPLNRMGFTVTTRDALHYQVNERRPAGRAAFLTFTYNFGQQPRLRNRPPTEAPEVQMPGQMGTP
jgi:ferric enterobactin receptor